MAISPAKRFRILHRDDFTCQYCGYSAPQVKLQVDHIVPISAGGTDDEKNLATACATCNMGKGYTQLTRALGPYQLPPDLRPKCPF